MNPQEDHDYMNTVDTLLDGMVNITPQPDPQFRAALEDRLVEQWRAQSNKAYSDRSNSHMSTLTLPVRRPLRRIPVTLAAALSAVALGMFALFALNNNRPPAEIPLAAPLLQPEATATITPSSTPFPSTVDGIMAQTASAAQQLTVTAMGGCVLRGDWTATHTVQEGDTLLSIATSYGVDPGILLVGNCLEGEGDLQTGATIFVPLAGVQALNQQATPVPLQNITATPIISYTLFDPNSLVPVVVARMDIPAGAQITVEMLIVTYWNVDDAPRLAPGSLESIAGLYAATNIPRYSPVFLNQLAEDPTGISTATFVPTPTATNTWTPTPSATPLATLPPTNTSTPTAAGS